MSGLGGAVARRERIADELWGRASAVRASQPKAVAFFAPPGNLNEE